MGKLEKGWGEGATPESLNIRKKGGAWLPAVDFKVWRLGRSSYRSRAGNGVSVDSPRAHTRLVPRPASQVAGSCPFYPMLKEGCQPNRQGGSRDKKDYAGVGGKKEKREGDEISALVLHMLEMSAVK